MLPPEQLRTLAVQLIQRVETLDHQVDTLARQLKPWERRSTATKR